MEMQEQVKAKYIQFINQYLATNSTGIMDCFAPVGDVTESFPGWDILHGRDEVKSGYDHIFSNVQAIHLEVPKSQYVSSVLNAHTVMVNAAEIYVSQVDNTVYLSRVQTLTVFSRIDTSWYIQARSGNSISLEQFSLAEWDSHKDELMEKARTAS